MEKEETFRVGETIIKQGSPSKGFYVLEKGAVEVLKDGMLLNVLIYPGTVFGEIGDILNSPRTCTIRARSETKVIRFETENLETLVQDHPEIAVKIMKTLASRLERTTQKLADLSSVSTLYSEPAK
ncbi:MAG: cyclic nucleotide-binding domain-containing protein [Puniceicoccaceae bacterium]|nr:MAG: cyclic nucleotide-binding domain-containing protein [Puniceicoccaceae bacterium]